MGLDAQERRLLIEMSGDVKSVIREVRANTEATRALDERMRKVEVKQGEQDVRVISAQNDIRGLWKAIRARPEGHGVIRAALEFFGALPDYWHALLVLGSLVAGATGGLAWVLHAAGGH